MANFKKEDFTGEGLRRRRRDTISLLKALSGDPTLIWVLYNLMPNLKPNA